MCLCVNVGRRCVVATTRLSECTGVALETEEDSKLTRAFVHDRTNEWEITTTCRSKTLPIATYWNVRYQGLLGCYLLPKDAVFSLVGATHTATCEWKSFLHAGVSTEGRVSRTVVNHLSVPRPEVETCVSEDDAYDIDSDIEEDDDEGSTKGDEDVDWESEEEDINVE